MSESRANRVANTPAISDATAERLADTMFALASSNRVHILYALLDGPRSVTDLMEALALEQSAVSHQLRVLLRLNLVHAEKIGRRRFYSLFDEHVTRLLDAALQHVDRKLTSPRRHLRNASSR